MSSSIKDRAVVDIHATEETHTQIADNLLAIHDISGADIVASLHGIGKTTVMKMAKKGNSSPA